MKDYGVLSPKRVVSLKSSFKDKDYDESRDSELEDRSTPADEQEDIWLQTHFEQCKRIILESGDLNAQRKWQLFELHVKVGRNVAEIAQETGLSTPQVEVILNQTIAKVRDAIGQDNLPQFNVAHAHRIRGRENLPRNNQPVWVDIPVDATLDGIMQRCRVSKSKAWKMLKQAQAHPERKASYIPGYHPHSEASRASLEHLKEQQNGTED